MINAVTEDDLLPLTEKSKEESETPAPEPEPEPIPPEEEAPEAKPEPEQTDNPMLSLLLIGAVVLIGGGIGYYFKIYKP